MHWPLRRNMCSAISFSLKCRDWIECSDLAFLLKTCLWIYGMICRHFKHWGDSVSPASPAPLTPIWSGTFPSNAGSPVNSTAPYLPIILCSVIPAVILTVDTRLDALITIHRRQMSLQNARDNKDASNNVIQTHTASDSQYKHEQQIKRKDARPMRD